MPISRLCPNTHPLLQIKACNRNNNNNNDTGSKSVTGKPKVSPQLNRWSRARAIRAGRKLDRSSPRTQTIESNNSPPPVPFAVDLDDTVSEDGSEFKAKSIYIVSDGTGWTAEHCVNAALGQFDYCLVDRGCPVCTHMFSGIDDVERLLEIIKQAVKEDALVVYTLADSSFSSAAEKACKLWGVPSTNVLGPITEAIASHLGVSPSGLPRGASGVPLSDDYFRRIEAIEFTIKQDDGASPQNLAKADIVLTGVSRTGKTPLSIYLAQKGYKDIRKTRAKTLGFSSESRTNYSEMDYIREELEFAGRLFAQNPVWPVIDVTAKAIEETAAVVLRLFHDRKHKYTMSSISKRY